MSTNYEAWQKLALMIPLTWNCFCAGKKRGERKGTNFSHLSKNMIVDGLPWAQGAESIETVVITTLRVSLLLKAQVTCVLWATRSV